MGYSLETIIQNIHHLNTKNMAINICIAGGTGWAGSALSKGVIFNDNINLVAAVSRSQAGNDLTEFLGVQADEIPIFKDVKTAIEQSSFEVLVEYTKPIVAKHNILLALENGIDVVVGTSGLSDEDYLEIEQMALKHNRSVLAVGNFALTVVLLQKFSEMAAKYIPNYEIIDYAHEGKIDSPSGTARELANKLSQVQESTVFVSEDELVGEKATRGARMNGVQVHSVRLPGHVISIESIFGLKDEKLTLRHDSGSSAEPYVKGAILAIEKVGSFKGLRRGLDSVMEF